MNGREALDRLNFDNNTILDDKISSKSFIKYLSLKANGNSNLTFHADSFRRKSVGQKHLVDGFK